MAQYTLNDECDYFSCDSERLRELDRACAPRRQAGTRHHSKYGEGGTGTLDVSVPLGWGKEGCCVSQLGSDKFNGPLKMSVH